MYQFKLWLLPALLETLGWAGIELLLWHLVCLGNGAVQQKVEEYFLATFVSIAKPGSYAVKPGSAKKGRTLKLLLPPPTISWW